MCIFSPNTCEFHVGSQVFKCRCSIYSPSLSTTFSYAGNLPWMVSWRRSSRVLRTGFLAPRRPRSFQNSALGAEAWRSASWILWVCSTRARFSALSQTKTLSVFTAQSTMEQIMNLVCCVCHHSVIYFKICSKAQYFKMLEVIHTGDNSLTSMHISDTFKNIYILKSIGLKFSTKWSIWTRIMPDFVSPGLVGYSALVQLIEICSHSNSQPRSQFPTVHCIDHTENLSPGEA